MLFTQPSFVFKLCLSLLSAAYASAVMMSALYSTTIGSYVVVSTRHLFHITYPRLGFYLNVMHAQGFIHLAVIASLLVASKRVDVDSSASLYDYYMLIWKAFYLEYFLLPFCTF